MWCWLVKNSSNKVTSSIILSNLTPIAAKDTLPKHASQLFEKQSSSKQNGLDKDCLKSDNYNDLSLLDLISAYYIGTAEKDYALEQFLNFKQKASVIQNKYFPEQSKTFVLTQERLLDALESICEVQIPHTELVRALAILGIEDLQSELDEDTFCVIALIIYSNLFSSLDKHVRQQQIVTQLQDNFNKIDLNGDQLIQAGELDIALERQFGNKIPKELQHQIMSVLDTNRSGVIKFDEFVDNVLHKCWKMQPKDVLSFDANVSDQLFDLSVTSFYEFKKQLLQKAFDHEALNHPYLQLLQEGNFLDIHEVLLDFAVEYRKYSRNFQTFVRTVMDKLESKEHKAVLQENISEESGYLSEEDLAVLAQVGIKKEWVDQIPHPKLFQNFLYVLQNLVGDNMECDNQILTPGQQFGDQVSEFCSNHNAAYALGMLSFGTEAIVKPLYRKIITCIEKYSQLELRQYVFFVLHVEVDDGHADLMMNILQDLDSPATRRDALSGMIEVLNARVQLWEGLLERIDKLGLIKNTKQGYVQGQVKHQGQRQEIALNSVTELYDAQSTNWVRKKPNCLSDFTARPIIFEACEPIKSLRVLDVGCGEGFCAREMRSRGACYVLGCDVSGEMVRAAVQEEVRNPLNGIKYIQADARDLVDSILKQGMSSTVGFASKVQFDSGCFDLAIAVFVFNYMPIQDMYKVGRNVYKLLQPGGRFVFSIPHPSFKYWPVEEGAPFKFDGSSGYFSGRDQMFTNCCSLEVGSCFPYLTLLSSTGQQRKELLSNLMVPQDIFLAEIKFLRGSYVLKMVLNQTFETIIRHLKITSDFYKKWVLSRCHRQESAQQLRNWLKATRSFLPSQKMSLYMLFSLWKSRLISVAPFLIKIYFHKGKYAGDLFKKCLRASLRQLFAKMFWANCCKFQSNIQQSESLMKMLILSKFQNLSLQLFHLVNLFVKEYSKLMGSFQSKGYYRHYLDKTSNSRRRELSLHIGFFVILQAELMRPEESCTKLKIERKKLPRMVFLFQPLMKKRVSTPTARTPITSRIQLDYCVCDRHLGMVANLAWSILVMYIIS
eukprot:TRINITY_DN1291_c0_g1_i5.p1 TRINITY_DN1291_c0_g1~~TRINITY_DN1291_c0_g1_i5.p1  ORF type:complete len:1140 (-),score=77.52 TRINITY_DN1291_c0_g1_i5:1747-4920(-)